MEDLPPLSLVANQLIAQLSDEYTSLEDMLSVIEQDAATTVRLLRLANSAQYHLPKPVVALDDAVTRVLGLDITRAVSLGIAFSAISSTTSCAVQNQRLIWLDSLLIASCTRSITAAITDHREQAGIAYTGALLGNLGMLVLASVYPTRVDRCFAYHSDLDEDERAKLSIGDLFKNEFSFDYSAISGALVSHWKLPLELMPIVTQSPNTANSTYACLAEYAQQARQLVDNHFRNVKLLPAVKPSGQSDELYGALEKTAARFQKISEESHNAVEEITASN